jgi:large subunit ribosomal protein L21
MAAASWASLLCRSILPGRWNFCRAFGSSGLSQPFSNPTAGAILSSASFLQTAKVTFPSLSPKFQSRPFIQWYSNTSVPLTSPAAVEEQPKAATPAPTPLFTPKEAPTIFAVVMVGGKQYKVVAGDVIIVEKLEAADVGQNILLQKVLLIGTKDYSAIGRPMLASAKVLAHVEEQTLAEKVRIFKKKRRKRYQRNIGYRHPITTLRILNIDFDPTVEHTQNPSSYLRSHVIS